MYLELKNEVEIIVSKISKNLGTINRGDIIIFRANENYDYIKRLIGKPGDTVNYKDDSLYINGKKVEEPYLTINKELSSNNKITQDFKVNDISGSHGKKVIPNNKYLVLGDNRLISNDSRSQVGLLDKEKIVGKAKIKILPLSNFKYDFYPQPFNKVNN